MAAVGQLHGHAEQLGLILIGFPGVIRGYPQSARQSRMLRSGGLVEALGVAEPDVLDVEDGLVE